MGGRGKIKSKDKKIFSQTKQNKEQIKQKRKVLSFQNVETFAKELEKRFFFVFFSHC